MKIYIHFEDEEPSHTLAHQPGVGATIHSVLEVFVNDYNARFQLSLDVNSLEIRNSRNKKLKFVDLVSVVASDKEDLFVRSSSSQKSKSVVQLQCKVTPHAITEMKADVSKNRITEAPEEKDAGNHQDDEMKDGLSKNRIYEASEEKDAGNHPDDDTGSHEHLIEHLNEVLMKQAALKEKVSKDDCGQLSPNAALRSAEYRFKFAMDRKAVAFETEDEMTSASIFPTVQNTVHSSCIKCEQPMFYKPSASLVNCQLCGFLQVGVECFRCGLFFPAYHEVEEIACPACASRAPLALMADCRRASFQTQEPPGGGRSTEAHLVVQYYRDSDDARRAEVDLCLRLNLENPLIRHVHVLTEEPTDLTAFQVGDKLVQHVVGEWLTYARAVDYANRFLPGAVVLLANADIHFHPSLALALQADLGRTVLALTRHDLDDTHPPVFYVSAAPISQDAWIFRAPLPHQLTDINFKFGKPGCDNRFAFELRRAGMRVVNPCFSVLVFHRHTSEKRNYVHGPDTVRGNYSSVVPVQRLHFP